MLEPKKSYCVILDDNTKDNSESFAVNLVVRYLVDLNIEQGITFGRSIFNNSMAISDTEFPNSKTIIISKCNRKHSDFELINISENKWDILFKIIGLDSKDESHKPIIKYIKTHLKNEKSVDILYYYITNIFQVAYNRVTKEFDINKANSAVKLFKNVYKGGNSRTDRLVSLINFIKFPNENNLFDLLKQYNNDYKSIANNIQALAEDRLPKNLVDMFSDVIASKTFTKNILQMMSYIVISEDYNEFILNCLKMIK